MGTENKPYLPPAEALELMITKAINREGGPLAASYEAHFKRTEESIAHAYRVKTRGETLEPTEVFAEAEKQSGKWADSIRAAYENSKGKKDDAPAVDANATQAVVSTAMNGGGVQGVMTTLMMALKPVQDFFAVIVNMAGGFLGSMFSKDIKATSWTEEWHRIETRDNNAKLLKGMAAHIGDQNAFLNELYNTTESDKMAVKTRPSTPAAETPASSAVPVEVLPDTQLDKSFHYDGDAFSRPGGLPMVNKNGKEPSLPIA